MYALSGARAAYLVAHESMIQRLRPFSPPWAVSLPAQIAAVESLRDTTYYKKQWAETHRLREAMIAELRTIPKIRVFGSIGNFFLISLEETHKSAQAIVDVLRKQNIFIRNCDSMGKQFHDNYLRIAVKNEEQNRKIVDALKKVLV